MSPALASLPGGRRSGSACRRNLSLIRNSAGYVPIRGVMVHFRVAEALMGDGGEFFHGVTYSRHPVACAVVHKNHRILRDEDVDKARRALDKTLGCDGPVGRSTRPKGAIARSGGIAAAAGAAGGARG